MIREWKEEIKYFKDNFITCTLLLGTLTGIIPCMLCGILLKILGL